MASEAVSRPSEGRSPEANARAPRPAVRVQIRKLGRTAYAAALRLQEEMVAELAASSTTRGTIFVLEHDAVYTLGRGADAADLMGAPARLGVPVFRIGRGGGATFHGPGQVVAYPVVRLPGHGRDVQGYIRGLERALVATCAEFAVRAHAIDGQTGAWTAAGKIAAIGIGVKRDIAFHGVALNVCNDVDFFQNIVACRAPGMAVTTMARELGAAPAREEVEDVLVRQVCRELGLVPVEGES